MKYIFLALAISSAGLAKAQTEIEIAALQNAAPHVHVKVAKKYAVDKSKNELQTVFTGLFKFYKNFISSQDMNLCVFKPSCSEYGIMSVRKYGAIKGMLLTFDRMSRCNAFSPENYKIDYKTKFYIDHP
ncbi:MAG: membrane protein insertion efficiency factor YidD [Bacteroidetes bacterium]|nr:membrane protein insertion efficiency factor YidD [Bacteroidota bacterium]